MKQENTKQYKTVVLSDIHMGSKWSHTEEVIEFLEGVSAERIILAGDIIDGWHLLRSRKKWKRHYNDFLTVLLDKYMDHGVEIVYIRGNHDDFLDMVVPFVFRRFAIEKEYIFESCGKRYFVFHGDSFDSVTSSARWVSKLGDKIYGWLLQINRHYNDYRRRHGKDYFSVAKFMKSWVKNIISKHSGFDANIVSLAKRKGCDAVICGHIHEPEIRMIDDILYLNSGDWVESLTALVQDFEGNWEIVNYSKKSIKADDKQSENK